MKTQVQLHAREPWRREGGHVLDAAGHPILHIEVNYSDDSFHLDRIVACVNEFTGIENPTGTIARAKTALEAALALIEDNGRQGGPKWTKDALKASIEELRGQKAGVGWLDAKTTSPEVREDLGRQTESVDVLVTDGKTIYAGYLQVSKGTKVRAFIPREIPPDSLPYSIEHATHWMAMPSMPTVD